MKNIPLIRSVENSNNRAKKDWHNVCLNAKNRAGMVIDKLKFLWPYLKNFLKLVIENIENARTIRRIK